MDEETVVREAAIESIANLLDFLDSDIKVTTIIPLWKKLCLEKPENIMNQIAKHFGAFVWHSKSKS